MSFPNVNDSYFDGHYKDIWRQIIPQELTPKEVDFMISYFGLDENSRVLDLMCGYGRHAIALAERGVSVTAVDNLASYIAEIGEKTKGRSLPLKAVQHDVKTLKIADTFDLAICMGNSLNFFGAADTRNILNNIHSNLRDGGHLLINTWSLAEIAIPSFVPRSWAEADGMKYLQQSRFLFQPTRIEWDSFILLPGGGIEEKKAVDYIYSVSEMEAMVTAAGFEWVEIFSIPGRKKFALGEPRAYIIAKKVKK